MTHGKLYNPNLTYKDIAKYQKSTQLLYSHTQNLVYQQTQGCYKEITEGYSMHGPYTNLSILYFHCCFHALDLKCPDSKAGIKINWSMIFQYNYS